MTVLPTAGGIDGPEGWYGISSVGSTGGLRTLVRCPHRVRWCGDLESIDWSRDGTRLAFGVTSYGSKNPYNGLHVLNVRTGRDIKIVREGEHREYGWLDIDWAPGGRRLAYVTFGHIAIVNADGSERRILQTGTVGRDHSPSWSPDGRWIAFATTIDGATSVYAIRADGSGRRLLTRSGSTPAWSPDGSRIVFLRGGRVEYLTPAGRLLTPRLLGPIDVTAAVWSPDSKEIAMSTARRGTWVMNTDGTELRQVTRYSGDSVAGGQRQRPAWRPLR